MRSGMSLSDRVGYEMKSFSGEYAVYGNDFKGNMVKMNCDSPWESASCIKVPILCEFARRVHQGTIDLSQRLKVTDFNRVGGSGLLKSLSDGIELPIIDIATLMIIVSDNTATNMMIEFLGIDNINECVSELGLKQTLLHNKIDFAKYTRLGTTTAREYGQLFEIIYQKKLYSKPVSEMVIDILSKQKYNTIMTRNLPQWLLDSENTGDDVSLKVISKSGSLDECRNDGGLIYTPYGAFVAVVFTRNFKDPIFYNDHEAYHFAPKITRLLFDHYISREGMF